jgi:hypothetical protein
MQFVVNNAEDYMKSYIEKYCDWFSGKYQCSLRGLVLPLGSIV